MKSITVLSTTLLAAVLGAAEPAALPPLSTANVVMSSPAKDSSGAMHLGNGSLGASAWMEEDRSLVILINHTDTFSEASRLLKIGRVRVRLEPVPVGDFRQELHLESGTLEIAAGDTRLTVLVEDGRPCIRVLGRMPTDTKVTVTDEGWRRTRTVLAGDPGAGTFTMNTSALGSSWTMDNAPAGIVVAESADQPLEDRDAGQAMGWYHRNGDSVVPLTLRHQGCAGLNGTFDPLLGRTFGAWIDGPGLQRQDARTLSGSVAALDLRITCPVLVTAAANEWTAAARRLASTAPSANDARAATARAWAAFWARSWIRVAGESRRDIPVNQHPLRIGYDSEGRNRQAGDLAGLRVEPRVATAEDIAAWAAVTADRDRPTPTGEQPQAPDAFAGGLTIAGWIRPIGTEAGRIVDRLTANHDDGFLFDTWPGGDSLRLLVGGQKIIVEHALSLGGWQHIAATYDPVSRRLALYRDGRLLEATGGEPDPLTRAYQRQRYVNACQNRGEFPPKFNGGMFTVEPRYQDAKLTYDADWRRWGDCYWFQNTRLIYHPMPMAGDTDLMAPLWALYRRPRALAEARAEAWYGVQGAWIPETMTLFGTYANKDYGWDRTGMAPGQVGSPWWRWAWNQTPELIDLLLKRWEWTRDETFLKTEVLPQAESLLRYFDTRFRRDDRGLLVIDPAQSAETYWHGVKNDLPNLAGLRCVLPRLMALPTALVTPAQQALFARLAKALPPLPVGDRTTKGGRLRVILPAEIFEDRTNNCENPELYAVWPFGCYGIGKPDLELARTTYRVRKFDLHAGWGYDGQVAARLGLTDDAAADLLGRTGNSHPAYTFPATWGPNFDWLPDQCHGGNLMTTAQMMVMQCDGDAITLLPAWPPAWDVDFRLHAPGNTVVEATVRQGVVERLEVTPASARKRITISAPFRQR